MIDRDLAGLYGVTQYPPFKLQDVKNTMKRLKVSKG